MKKYNYFKNGYTLLEVIVTVIILGVIASLAIPNYVMSVEKTKAAEGAQMLEALLNAQRRYAIEHEGDYATGTDQLDISFTTKSNNFNDPKVDNDVSKLAEIERIGGEYLLSIDENGVIYCERTADLCPKLGYTFR